MTATGPAFSSIGGVAYVDAAPHSNVGMGMAGTTATGDDPVRAWMVSPHAV